MEVEDIYIRLYEGFVPRAEYLQADSRDRNIILESFIVAGLSLALHAFVESFFGGLGKAAAEPVINTIKGKFKKAAGSGDRTAVLEALELMEPYLKHLSEMTDSQLALYRSAVAAVLGTRGYPRDVANEASTDVIAVLLAAGGAHTR